MPIPIGITVAIIIFVSLALSIAYYIIMLPLKVLRCTPLSYLPAHAASLLRLESCFAHPADGALSQTLR